MLLNRIKQCLGLKDSILRYPGRDKMSLFVSALASPTNMFTVHVVVVEILLFPLQENIGTGNWLRH